jgi:hypothetical protein
MRRWNRKSFSLSSEMRGEEVNVVDEADVEHAGTEDLIAGIRSMQPNDHRLDVRVKVLGGCSDHRDEEEQCEMFLKRKEAGMNMQRVGTARRAQDRADGRAPGVAAKTRPKK